MSFTPKVKKPEFFKKKSFKASRLKRPKMRFFQLGNSIIMELHFREFSRSLTSKFWRKEFYQLYLLKWFYAVDGKDYFQIFTFAITPNF